MGLRTRVWRLAGGAAVGVLATLGLYAGVAAPISAAQAATSPCPAGQPTGNPPGHTSSGKTGRPSYPIGECQLLLSHGIIPAGGQLTATGTGYAAGAGVAVSLDPGSVRLASVVTDNQGDFTTTLTIPRSTRPGRYDVVASGEAAGGGTLRLEAALTVIAKQATGLTSQSGSASLGGGSAATTNALSNVAKSSSASANPAGGSAGSASGAAGKSGSHGSVGGTTAGTPAAVGGVPLSGADKLGIILGAFALLVGTSAAVLILRRRQQASAR